MSCVLFEHSLPVIIRRGFVLPLRTFCSAHHGRKSSTTASSSGYAAPKKFRISSFPETAVGQPTYITHPHLLKKGEVIPRITISEFQHRRHRLLESIESHSPKHDLHIVLVPSSPKKYMTEKIPYVFRQNSDFLYLSGCLEPDSALLLTSHNKQYESYLFLRGKDPHAELWDGPRTGFEEAVEMFGVDRSLPFSDLSMALRHLFKKSNNFVLWFDYMAGIHNDVLGAVKDVLPENKMCESPRPLIQKLRLKKSPAEQDLMRNACSIGSEAISRTMRSSKPGCSEAQLFARVDYESRMLGAQFLAYPPVVAGGSRANIIHYINNDQIVEANDLVLMDAGCDYHGYSSDITRTWPVSGKFTPEQRELYEVLHEVQIELIKECERRPNLDQLFHLMCLKLGKGLRELGAIPVEFTSNDDLSRAAFSLCPHHVGHYLGMDIHDTSSVPRSLPLEPGMIFTVEPGLYVNATNKFANPRYHGLGMRIEDDILVTETGLEVLTASCPKHPDEIEELLRNPAAL